MAAVVADSGVLSFHFIVNSLGAALQSATIRSLGVIGRGVWEDETRRGNNFATLGNGQTIRPQNAPSWEKRACLEFGC
jgi:hypothetical protein